MSDFTKLKDYLNENKGSNSATDSNPLNGLSNLKDSVFDFFGKGGSRANGFDQPRTSDDQMESWFREAENDKYCPQLSRKQRIIGFMFFLFMSAFCMTLASFCIPFILIKSRKFVLLFSLGSLFFIFSFSLLWGVKNHLKHLFNSSRLPFTLSYFFTLFATVYYALWIHSVLLTLIFGFLQVATLVWYLLSYLPGGQSALKLFAKLFYSLVSKTVQTSVNNV